MSNAPHEWTLEGFVDHFDFFHHKMLDHKFVWVLGAGASRASGIPLGSELVDRWLKELHVREHGGKTPLEDWATAKNLGINGFKYEDRASFYPKVYERRFREYPDEGYAYLESVMADADPSPGYSILAAALAGDPPQRPPRHNAVVTTNFDNLVADALSIYTNTFPFVCGHELLTPFVRVAMRRPVVCKIHRDLLLAPQSDPRSMRRLHDAWGMALRALFEHYTPLFIGYGGNDDTLMDLLESLPLGDIKGQMIWCYYEGGQPSDRIVNLVADHKGILVPVPDFDLLMVLLGEKMGIALLGEEIGRRARLRTKRYRRRIQRLDTVKHPEVTKALAATYDRSGGWWAWDQKASSETDPQRREVVYRQGIQHCPQSPEIRFNFALFLKSTGGKIDEVESLFRAATELDSMDADYAGELANFMTDVRRDHDEAERLYRKALELDPKDAVITSNFANFMTDVRRDHDEAERLYRKALELDPKDAGITSNFANFMTDVRRDHDEAERLYRKALELDPKDVGITSNFANFMTDVRGDHDEAERLYRKAVELDPKDAGITGNFANFMTDVRGDHDEAERLYRKALELDPKDAGITSNFANFMTDVRRDHDEAERLHRKAVELDPKDAIVTSNFAIFMTEVRGDHDEAERLYRKALELDPKSAGITGNFAEFLIVQGRLEEAAVKLREARSLNEGQENALAAALSLNIAIVAGVTKKDDTDALEELRNLLSVGVSRGGWSFENVLDYAQQNVAPEDHALYSAFADAILDPDKVPAALALLDQRSATAKAGIDREPKMPVIDGQQSSTDGQKEAIENK